MADLGDCRLYLCTGNRPDLADFVRACVRGGVDVVQLREKGLEARALVRRAKQLAAVCADLGVPFIVNDRPDLALASGAGGVHVGQDDVEPGVARAILGPTAIVGLSTHAPAEWDAATAEPVDYLSVGPVSETPTKPGRPGTGAGFVSYVAGTEAGRRLPWFVTGGVTPSVVPGLARAGARRFVAVRYLTESADPAAAARRLRASIDEAVEAAGA